MANMADVEWATRLASVINRHKNINVKKLSEHKDLGLEAKEKQKIEKKIEKGESPHEVRSRQFTERHSSFLHCHFCFFCCRN